MGETLTLAKFGLPQVRGQTSARIYYQQSLARPEEEEGVAVASSVILHDPTREKTVALDAPGVGLSALPSAILTTSQLGKTYMQGLPPHLQQRFYLDPLRGAAGTLVLKGVFHDEAAGEDYLDLNVLTPRETAQLKNLVPIGADQSRWAAAIDALTTTVETFKPDPAKFGAYIVDPAKTVSVGPSAIAAVSSPDTAVDSYALTATGKGTGYVTMVFGDGRAFTPEGDPVQVQVFKVAPQLYTGDLKAVSSSNPLDEQVTLRHSGDFAGTPEDYEFQWRWATGEASAPATYSKVLETKIGTTQFWDMFSDPGALSHPAADDGIPVQLPRSVVMRPAAYTGEDEAAGFPGLLLQLQSLIDFGSDEYPLGIPDNIVFSATLGQLDGFVLYVNGQAALAHNAPTQPFPLTNAGSGLSASGLVKQFRLPPGVFTAGENLIAIGLYTASDANVPTTVDFRLEAAREDDLVTSVPSVWQDPLDTGAINTNTAIVGGSPANPFGGSAFVLNDRWFTMRYRPKASAGNVLGTSWSRWMPPQFVEGWVKRVLAAINPFEQRVKDLQNNQTDSTVSVLTQAGTRWEGNIALTLDNINDAGLISIYETVFTRGINSGEVLYAVNYNIREKAGSSTSNGVIDEADAQRMFPQGHGDAYGHYLTALTNYYRLLTHDNFTWTPRAESVTVLGQPVTVDFTDERKFAAAAGNVARTAAQVIALAHRRAYQDDPAAGWSQFRDRTPVNTSTGVARHQGMDEWVSRGSQGAFLNWVVANAILPAEDNYHSGVRKIDRTTVPELAELPTQAVAFQSAIDNANAHLNPLGLSPDAIAFDLSPAELKAGVSHFEQISGRALKSLNNAAGAFNQAAIMTRSLRNQQNTVDDYSAAITDQETAYTNQLIDIFGRPYSGEIGAGKTYDQDYAGPDLFHWFIVDRASDLIDTSQAFTVSASMPLEYKTYNRFFEEYDMSRSEANDDWLNQHWSDAAFESTKRTVTVNPSQYVQYNNVWQPGGLGSRAETGELQDALQETQRTWLALSAAATSYRNLDYQLARKADVLQDLLTTIGAQQSNTATTNNDVYQSKLIINSYMAESGRYQGLSQLAEGIAAAVVEAFPRVAGLAYDVTSTWRSVTKYAMIAGQISFAVTSGVYLGRANDQEAEMLRLKQNGELMRQVLQGRYEATQQVYEFENLYRECVSHGAELGQLTLAHLRALQEVTNVLARGNRILAERGVFRQRAAAVIQGYRTKDVAFRLFRDESLEQYRSLFDLASRYTYLAAKS